MNKAKGALTGRTQKHPSIPHGAAALHIEPLLEVPSDLNVLGIEKYGLPMSTQHRTLREHYMSNCYKPSGDVPDQNDTAKFKTLTAGSNNKLLLSQASKVIGQAKKAPLSNCTVINHRTATGSFSPNLGHKHVARTQKEPPMVTTARPNKDTGELKAAPTTHAKATSSCSIIPAKKSAEIPLSSNRVSDLRPGSKNGLEAHKPMVAVNKSIKTVQIKAPKETNLTTVCTERRQSKGLLKSTKQNLQVEYEDSTRDASEGIRVERLKEKLKELASQTTRATERPKNAVTSVSPDMEHRPVFGNYKKSLVVLKDTEKSKLLGNGKHSLMVSHEVFNGKKAKGAFGLSPAKETSKMGKTMAKEEVPEELLDPRKGKENEIMWKSLTEKDLQGKGMNGVGAVKMKMEMTRMKLNLLKSRLKKVLRNCPKMINALTQKLSKIM